MRQLGRITGVQLEEAEEEEAEGEGEEECSLCLTPADLIM